MGRDEFLVNTMYTQGFGGGFHASSGRKARPPKQACRIVDEGLVYTLNLWKEEFLPGCPL